MSNNNNLNKKEKIKEISLNYIFIGDSTQEINEKSNYALKSIDNMNENITKKSNYLIYQSNTVNINRNETPKKVINKINTKKSEIEENLFNSNNGLKFNRHKNSAESTNNSSIDDDIKMSDSDKKILNKIKKAIKENKNYKISSAINNAKIVESFKKSHFKDNNLNFNCGNNKFNNSNSFVNHNFNYIYNNNIDLNNYNNYKYILTYNYYLYTDKLKNNQSDLKEVLNKIKALTDKTLSDLFLMEQSQKLFNYINNIVNNDNNKNIQIIKDKKLDVPQHLYFYTNHEEETQTNNVLYLIEGLFHEENLKKDYFLLNMLNRDGYAPLKKLVNHPQVHNCKISENQLRAVFSEHRENEITETVETFDDIIIRNKKWIKLKKEIGSVLQVKECTLSLINDKKNEVLRTLLEKRKNLILEKNKILYKFQNNNMKIQQKINEFQFNHNNFYPYNINNTFNNIYNNNLYNNFIYNKNLYNNIYNNNLYSSLFNNKRY